MLDVLHHFVATCGIRETTGVLKRLHMAACNSSTLTKPIEKREHFVSLK